MNQTEKACAVAFATSYLYAMRDHQTDPSGTDTWMSLGKHDLNLCGDYFAEAAPKGGLVVYVYPGDWKDVLPEPLHTFTVNAI